MNCTELPAQNFPRVCEHKISSRDESRTYAAVMRKSPYRFAYLYRPQTKFAKVMFLQVSVCPYRGGAWFYLGGVHGFIWGACVVLFGGACVVLFRGCAWFYSGGMHGFIQGVHGFIQGGMHGFIRGGMCGFISGGMRGFFSFFRYNEIRSMSRRYASYWNAFLLDLGGREHFSMNIGGYKRKCSY